MNNKVKITKVDILSPRELENVNLAQPAVGEHSANGFAFALHVQSKLEVESISINYQNYLHETLAPAGVQVEGNIRHYHFSAEISAIGLPESFALGVFLKCKDAQDTKILRIEGGRKRIRIEPSTLLFPISVNGIPRSGTTLTMGLISAHPWLITKNAYPFEHRPALYWAHLFQALSRPNNEVGARWNWEFESDRRKVGPFTYYKGIEEIHAWIDESYLHELAVFCRNNINSVYLLIKEAQGKHEAKFFVEKFPGWKGRYVAELFDSYQQVVVVRDIRDVYCSVKKFNARRGRNDFGVDGFSSEEGYLKYLGNMLKQMLQMGRQDDDRIKTHIIKYEDVMKNPQEAIQALYKSMGLPVNSEVLSALNTAMESPQLNNLEHRTGSITVGGTQSWRYELSSELNAKVWQHAGAELSSLGYEEF